VKNIFSTKRKKEIKLSMRNDFERDFDKVIFSDVFRRLNAKTQVFPFMRFDQSKRNDNIHTRLTHSLEVSSVGRSLGFAFGKMLKEKGENIEPYEVAVLTQVACLIHDLGNPPFGHMGEYAIREWFKDEGSKYLEYLDENLRYDFLLFEGNAQGFRFVTKMDDSYVDYGMNLTFASLASIVKYPWVSSDERAKKKKKFHVFYSEKDIFEEVFNDLGLKKDGEFIRHPVSFLMEAADDLCYRILDIEDGVELGILSYEEAKEVLLKVIKLKYNDFNINESLSKNQKIAQLRGAAISSLANLIFEEFENNFENIINGEMNICLLDSLEKNNKTISEILEDVDRIYEKLFNSKSEIELGAYELMNILLKTFVDAVYKFHNNKVAYNEELAIKILGNFAPLDENSYFENLHRVMDFIAGMTDNYALYLANQLRGNFK
jgi:dGTPase